MEGHSPRGFRRPTLAPVDSWQQVAARQAGLATRAQLAARGVDRFGVRNQVAAGRWVCWGPTVVATTTGDLHRHQLQWLGVLHAGRHAILGDLSAAEPAGLEHWHRDVVTVWVPDENDADDLVGVPALRFVRTRRPLVRLRAAVPGVPRAGIEPAVLHFAAYQPSARTAQGVVAAAVQQRLTTAEDLLGWVDRMRPLRRAPLLREALGEIAGGAHSVAELDVNRLCRDHGLARPARQVRRRDARGALRFTDCEWRLADGRTLVLEIDGAFHLDVRHWEDDLARHRALTARDRLVVRCTARELREEPARVAADLRALGVPLAA